MFIILLHQDALKSRLSGSTFCFHHIFPLLSFSPPNMVTSGSKNPRWRRPKCKLEASKARPQADGTCHELQPPVFDPHKVLKHCQRISTFLHTSARLLSNIKSNISRPAGNDKEQHPDSCVSGLSQQLCLISCACITPVIYLMSTGSSHTVRMQT